MAIKKVDKKSKKEVEYVSSGLDIKYSIPVGLITMLARAAKITEKEVWCSISNISNICAARLLSKFNSGHRWPSSWTTKEFPGAGISIRIDMSGSQRDSYYDSMAKTYIQYDVPKKYFHCKIKISGNAIETYTQEKIDEYITSTMEEELLGTLDDEQG